MISISVVIPLYNRAFLIEEALNSVLSQTVKPVEIIVVDDGSTDNSLEIVNSFSKKSFIPTKIVSIPHCGMVGYVRNRGVEIALGDWIAFLDSDDLWLKDKLENQIALTKKYRAIHTKEIWLKNGTIVSQRKRKFKKEGDIFEDALDKCIIGPSTLLIEKKLFNELGGFNITLEVAEDYEFFLRLLDKNEIGYIKEPTINKRDGHWKQLSHKYGSVEFFHVEALKELLKWDKLSNRRRYLVIYTLKRKIEICHKIALKKGNSKKATEYNSLLSNFEELM